MMTKILGLVGLGLTATVAAASSESRLLEFGRGDQVWATPEEVDAFTLSGRNFFDVTDHPQKTNALRQERVATYDYPSTVSHREQSLDMFEAIDVEAIRSTIASMSAYHNRYYTSQWGVESVEWLASEYQGVIDASGRSDANVTLYEHSAWAQPSIVATIHGSSDEILVFGGHIDSTAPGMPTGRAPGADDDASGSAVVLEMFRILLSSGFTPTKTIEFHGYAAEEVGLRGSQDIASAYRAAGKKVMGMVNFDMTIFPDSNNPRINFITDFVDGNLTSHNMMLCDAYDIPYMSSRCGYACSDHASFFQNGFPSSHPWEAQSSNRRIHTTDDTLDLAGVDVSHSILFTKLGLATAVELGSF